MKIKSFTSILLLRYFTGKQHEQPLFSLNLFVACHWTHVLKVSVDILTSLSQTTHNYQRPYPRRVCHSSPKWQKSVFSNWVFWEEIHSKTVRIETIFTISVFLTWFPSAGENLLVCLRRLLPARTVLRAEHYRRARLRGSGGEKLCLGTVVSLPLFFQE